jgi:hypothetical protein
VDVRWRDGQGRPQATTLRLTPGRHEIVLGEPTAPPPVVAGGAGGDIMQTKGKAG